jgi:hypothetical protein
MVLDPDAPEHPTAPSRQIVLPGDVLMKWSSAACSEGGLSLIVNLIRLPQLDSEPPLPVTPLHASSR